MLTECYSRKVVQGLQSSGWTYTNASEQGPDTGDKDVKPGRPR